VNLAEAIRRRFAPFGSVDDLGLPPSVPVGEPLRFFDQTLTEVRGKSASTSSEEMEALIDEAGTAARSCHERGPLSRSPLRRNGH
jgi:hypothetical protein